VRRVGLIVVVCVVAGCAAAARDTGSADTTRESVKACAADNDPLTVARSFVVAAEAGDQAAIERCMYPAEPLGSDLIAIVASGGWLLDQVRAVQKNSALKVGPNTVGFDFTQPPQPRGTVVDSDGQSHSLGPDHQSGLQIAVTLEPDGLRYVTDVLAYASS
jgi:hypothetical protein